MSYGIWSPFLTDRTTVNQINISREPEQDSQMIKKFRDLTEIMNLELWFKATQNQDVKFLSLIYMLSN